MNIKKNKYPIFWQTIKKSFNRQNINKKLICPMNYLTNIQIPGIPYVSPVEMSEFLKPYIFKGDRRTCKRVETLIEKYSLKKYSAVTSGYDDEDVDILLRSDFDKLIYDIKNTYISRNYKDLMYWLINRAFLSTIGVQKNRNLIKRRTDKNRSILLKVLYNLNKEAFLSCFTENTHISCTPDEN